MSLGHEPVRTKHAGFSPDLFLNKIPYNPVYSLKLAFKMRLKNNTKAIKKLIKKYQIKNDHYTNYFPVQYNISLKKLYYKNIKPNVVIIINESMAEWVILEPELNYQVLPFTLKFIKDKNSIYFNNYIPNNDGTIRGISNIITGIPNLPFSKPFSYYPKPNFKKINFSLAEQFKKEGYQTVFFYGGRYSWENLGNFLKKWGFDILIGEPDFQKKEILDWGIADEILLDKVNEFMEKTNRPTLAVIMTTTNHPPFELPKNFKVNDFNFSNSFKKKINVPEKIIQKRLKTYHYSDYTLKKFFNKAKNTNYYKNTIFAVTGDHSFRSVLKWNKKNFYKKDLVPLIIHTTLYPELLKNKDTLQKNFGSHIDLTHTILSLCLNNFNTFCLSKNMLLPQKKKFNISSEKLLYFPNLLFYYDIMNEETNIYKKNNKFPENNSNNTLHLKKLYLSYYNILLQEHKKYFSIK
jgi:phosphoglycerol transferase MdoB-like AlkP superfamily enzyme